MWDDWTKQQRIEEAMYLAGMHYDRYESQDDCLRFDSESGIVTYFDSWEQVVDWLHGTVFDDPELEADIEDLLDFPEERPSVLEQLRSAKEGDEHIENTRNNKRACDLQR